MLGGVLRVPERCLEGAWMVSGGYLEDVAKVSGSCLDDIQKVSGWYLECVRKVTGKNGDSVWKLFRRFWKVLKSFCQFREFL